MHLAELKLVLNKRKFNQLDVLWKIIPHKTLISFQVLICQAYPQTVIINYSLLAVGDLASSGFLTQPGKCCNERLVDE